MSVGVIEKSPLKFVLPNIISYYSIRSHYIHWCYYYNKTTNKTPTDKQDIFRFRLFYYDIILKLKSSHNNMKRHRRLKEGNLDSLWFILFDFKKSPDSRIREAPIIFVVDINDYQYITYKNSMFIYTKKWIIQKKIRCYRHLWVNLTRFWNNTLLMSLLKCFLIPDWNHTERLHQSIKPLESFINIAWERQKRLDFRGLSAEKLGLFWKVYSVSSFYVWCVLNYRYDTRNKEKNLHHQSFLNFEFNFCSG